MSFFFFQFLKWHKIKTAGLKPAVQEQKQLFIYLIITLREYVFPSFV